MSSKDNQKDLKINTEHSKTYEASFSISYDAKESSFSEHKINAKILAESILGVQDIIDETIRVMSKSSEKASLLVSAPIKQGSVIIDFLLSSPTIPVADALKYIGLAIGAPAGMATLLNFVSYIKNKKVTHIEVENNQDKAKLYIEGEEDPLICNKVVAQLSVDKKVRDALHKVIQAPVLGKEDARVNILDSNNNLVETIEDEKINDFLPLPKGTLEDIYIENETLIVSFSQVNFGSVNGWQIRKSDGEEYSVKMKDDTFLSKVTANQQEFKKEDLFEIELKTKTIDRPTRATITREVIRVTKHLANKERKLV